LGIPTLDRHVQHGVGAKQVGQRFRLLLDAFTLVGSFLRQNKLFGQRQDLTPQAPFSTSPAAYAVGMTTWGRLKLYTVDHANRSQNFRIPVSFLF